MNRRRVALVTGSTSGIGAGIAHALAASGHDIVLNGFGEAPDIERLVDTLAATHDVQVVHEPADLANPDAAVALVHRAEHRFERVDVLVNNAGRQHVAPVQEFPPEQWDAIVALNLSAAFHTIRAVLPGMMARGFGRIVNIASVHGLVASVEKVAYVAAKHGIVGMTRVVALEQAANGITCNAVCPGFVDTPLVRAQIERVAAPTGGTIEDGARALLAGKHPSGRFVSIDEVAALVAFLASDAAASITGTALPIDGGWTAQ